MPRNQKRALFNNIVLAITIIGSKVTIFVFTNAFASIAELMSQVNLEDSNTGTSTNDELFGQDGGDGNQQKMIILIKVNSIKFISIFIDDPNFLKREQDYFKAKWANGLLRISNLVCRVFANLVVKGEEYGNIWIDDRCNDNGIKPLKSSKNQRKGFLDRHEEWLDLALIL